MDEEVLLFLRGLGLTFEQCAIMANLDVKTFEDLMSVEKEQLMTDVGLDESDADSLLEKLSRLSA